MHASRPRLGSARRLASALCVAALVLPALAHGQERRDEAASRALARARAAIEAVDYDAAVAAVRPLLASPTASVRVSALELKAVADLLVGRQVEGRQSLEQLYTLSPAFLLHDPTLPPRVTSEFEAAAAKPRPRAVTPVLQPAPGGPTRFEIRAAGATRDVAVACRTSPGEPFVAVPTQASGGAWRFDLPRPSPSACHAVALDEEGVAIGRLGTPMSPFEVRPRAAPAAAAAPAPASEDHPITTRWWFWTGVAAVVVGGAVVTYVATRPSEQTLPRSEVTISTLSRAAATW
jgi:hypothetical protein